MQSPNREDQNSQSLDLVKYLVLLWHWSWVIVIAVVVAAIGAYIVSKVIPPVYQAKTTVLVDMAPPNKSLDYNTLLLSSQLTQTYSQMLIKTPVLEEVASRLGIPAVDPKTITAKPVTNTQLINICAESTNPELAADVANIIVAVFADQVSSLQEIRFSASEQSLQAQMTDIENKINGTTACNMAPGQVFRGAGKLARRTQRPPDAASGAAGMAMQVPPHQLAPPVIVAARVRFLAACEPSRSGEDSLSRLLSGGDRHAFSDRMSS